MNYKLIEISWFFGFSGFTCYPFIFRVNGNVDLAHEEIHLEQQYKWYKYGWYFGILAWLFCYLCILPIGWNPFRYKWESEAYMYLHADDYKEPVPQWVKDILKQYYFLWF